MERAAPGTNVIQVAYSNLLNLTDSRTVAVARPDDSDGDGMSDYAEILAGTNPLDSNSLLRITQLTDGHQLVVWDSVAGRKYRVVATTNLAAPMQSISPVIPATGASAFFFDSATNGPLKFYRVQLVP